MERLIINGGNLLKGSVEINGAKNAAVAILPATVMAHEGKCIVDNIPDIEDVHCLERILKSLGCSVNKIDNNTLEVDSTNVDNFDACIEDVRRMRASYYFIGALLARFKEARVVLPGGCPIGVRPIDQHIKGFEALGAKVVIEHGAVKVKAERLVGANIFFDVVSVGATINVMIAATLAEGVTTLENVAKEPHVVDVANFLNSMGANIKGAGFGKITIEGVDKLKGVSYTPIYDRIEAGTFMVAAAITNSKIKINGFNEEHLRPLIEKLKECGVKFGNYENNSVIVDGKVEKRPLDIKTLPYPGFPTDMQPQMMSLLSVVNGVSVITETVFENRFMHVAELQRMGANIKIDGRTAVVEGTLKLTGCEVKATDLRAGAAMILSGLIAEGETIIGDIYHIDRGYVNIEEKFSKLGAEIYRVKM